VAAHSAELHVRADEPAADGHFPGNPIVPGAVLLREVLRFLAPGGEATCRGIRSARFFRPVRPGDRLTVRWDASAAGDISFTCSAGTCSTGTGGHRVLSGTICLRAW
jgi:3-hydroxymyristoyl/3-hydroxydecanoyl-(acyl carrier protein) dehydratase